MNASTAQSEVRKLFIYRIRYCFLTSRSAFSSLWQNLQIISYTSSGHHISSASGWKRNLLLVDFSREWYKKFVQHTMPHEDVGLQKNCKEDNCIIPH